MSYVDVLKDAANIVIQNPKILLPYVIFTAISIIIGFYAVAQFSTALTTQMNMLINQTVQNQTAINSGTNVTNSLSTTAMAFKNSLDLPITAVLIVVSALVGVLFGGLYISLAKQYHEGNKKVSISKAFELTKQRYLPLLVAGIIVFLIILGVFLILLGLVGIGYLLGTWGLILMCIVAVIVGILLGTYLGVLLYLTSVMVIVEGRGGVDAVKRSIEIGRTHLGSIFVLLLLIFAFSLLADFVIQLVVVPIQLIVDFASFSQASLQSGALSQGQLIGSFITTFISSVLGSVLSVWILLVAPLYYYEFIAGAGKGAPAQVASTPTAASLMKKETATSAAKGKVNKAKNKKA